MKHGSKQSLHNTPLHRAYPQNKLTVHILINSSLDVANINAYVNFGQNPSTSSQQNSDINQGS